MSRLRELVKRVLDDNHAHGYTTPETLNELEAALQADDAGAVAEVLSGAFGIHYIACGDPNKLPVGTKLYTHATPPAKAEAAGLVLVGWQYTGSDDGALVRDIAAPPEWKTDGEHRPVYVLARDAMEGEVAALPPPPVDGMQSLTRNDLAKLLVASCIDINAGHAVIEFEGMTDDGKEVGNWRVAVERIAAAPATPAGKVDANCWAEPFSDSWFDAPDDAEFVHGRKVGDEYELTASVRGWTERYRVVKVPDDTNDDYEVVRIHPEPVQGEKDHG